jgi:hypothetical protein
MTTADPRARKGAAKKPRPAATSPANPHKTGQKNKTTKKKKEKGGGGREREGKGEGPNGGGQSSLLPRACPDTIHKRSGLYMTASRVSNECNECLFSQQGTADRAVPDRVDCAVQAIGRNATQSADRGFFITTFD